MSWPKGDRLYLAAAICELLVGLLVPPVGLNAGTVIALTLSGALSWLWWRSRDDDDGPSAT